jgi:branched-chain amino acid transport system substrate-binding protein
MSLHHPYLVIRLLPLAAALFFSSCGKEPSAGPIKLGEVHPLTGKEAAFGQSTQRGIRLALEEINARGGVLGRPLVSVAEDNQSKPGESATIAKKLITRDKVAAVLCGGTSSNCLEIGPVCQAARVPFVATTATEARVTEMGPFVFRVCFIDPFQGRVLANFAHGTLKAKRVALLTSSTSSFSVGLSRAFRERFTALGGEIPVEQKYSEGDKDFRAQLTAIRAQNVDAVAATGFYTEAALICKQARELGLSLPLLGGDGWEAPELIAIGGSAVNGTYYSTHYSSESTAPAVQEFVRKYRAKYANEVPDALAALGYDAAMIVADAIKRAGSTDAERVRAALAATADFPGVTGRTTIDAQRNASKPAVILAVRDGRFNFVETVAP